MKRIIELAREEAVLIKTDFIGLTHVMLGLFRNDGSSAKRLIEQAGITIDELRADLQQTVYAQRNSDLSQEPKMLPFTKEAKEVFAIAEDLLNLKNYFLILFY